MFFELLILTVKFVTNLQILKNHLLASVVVLGRKMSHAVISCSVGTFSVVIVFCR